VLTLNAAVKKLFLSDPSDGPVLVFHITRGVGVDGAPPGGDATSSPGGLREEKPLYV